MNITKTSCYCCCFVLDNNCIAYFFNTKPGWCIRLLNLVLCMYRSVFLHVVKFNCAEVICLFLSLYSLILIRMNRQKLEYRSSDSRQICTFPSGLNYCFKGRRWILYTVTVLGKNIGDFLFNLEENSLGFESTNLNKEKLSSPKRQTYWA